MSAYAEILKWSEDRPSWQRDALRLLVSQGQIDDVELARLVRVAKSSHALLGESDSEQVCPLTEVHIPQQPLAGGTIVLAKLYHARGVNALAAGQVQTYQPQGLTVVYGDNGAGKSGYARILKRMCRARVPEPRLESNVFATASSEEQSATVDFYVAGEKRSFEWKQAAPPEQMPRELAAISIFDTASATAYLTSPEKAPFAPAGLDIFEKLAKTCELLRACLESEVARDMTPSWPVATVAEGTSVKRLLDTLSAETLDSQVAALAQFGVAEAGRIAELTHTLSAISSNNPAKRARELRAAASRLDALAQWLDGIEQQISDDALAGLRKAKDQAMSLEDAARSMRDRTFAEQPLAGIGDGAWRTLWESARRFSTEAAYRMQSFPVVDAGARCVLCQQELADEGRRRLRQFDEFVQSDTAARAAVAARTLQERYSALVALEINHNHDASFAELDDHHAELAAATHAFLGGARTRRAVAAAACETTAVWPECEPLPPSPLGTIRSVARTLETEAARLSTEDEMPAREELLFELRDLQGREWLARNSATVLAEVGRLRRRKRYEKCIESTQTRGITKKGAELTRKLVSESMERAFVAELKKLDVAHVQVRIDTDAKRGALLHEVRLDAETSKVPASRVLSEGECRCVSLAAFLAELATADHASGIVFDDPVSSLDHMRRRRVADRLVQEARVRQVIIFTHDLAFLLLLKECAERGGVSLYTEQVRALRDGPGICQPGLPWAGMNVKDRIARLNEDAQALVALHKANDVDAYEREVKALYGRLREAWERGVEEVLLNGAVQRFERGISTKPLRAVTILDDDLELLEQGMAKTSRWLVGHDDAPELNEPVPPPDEVRADVAALSEWAKTIRKRREKKS